MSQAGSKWTCASGVGIGGPRLPPVKSDHVPAVLGQSGPPIRPQTVRSCELGGVRCFNAWIGTMPSVQPVTPHLRVRANELVFLQVLQCRPQVITGSRRKYKGKSFVKLTPRELPLCKRSLKNSGGQVSCPVSDPQLAAHRRRSVSPGLHEPQPKTAKEDLARDRSKAPAEQAALWDI